MPYKKDGTPDRRYFPNHVKKKKKRKYITTGHRNIRRLLKQNKGTSTTDFINKYHKNKGIWSNKIAYLAGIVDGEGYLKMEKSGTIRLIIGMTDKKTIKWIYDTFGGSMNKQKTAKGKLFYVWRMNQGKDLFYLLLLIIPFLKTKKKKLVDAFHILINKFSELEDTLYPYNREVKKSPT